MELDPHNIRTQSFHATVLMHARRFDEAIAVARKALSAQPNEVARSALIDSLFKKGMACRAHDPGKREMGQGS